VQSLLLDDVEAGNAEVANVVANQAGNVVVPDEQDVHGHVLAKGDQLVRALRVLESAALEKVQGLLREPSGLLDCHLDPGRFVGHVSLLSPSFQRLAVTTGSTLQVSGHAADGRDADPGPVVDLAIGKAAVKQFRNQPSVFQCLQLGRCAEVDQKGPDLCRITQAEDGPEQ
jgi:hypothetical protein